MVHCDVQPTATARIPFIFCVLVELLLCGNLQAQESGDQPAKTTERTKRFLESAAKAAGEYRFTATSDESETKFKLQSEPLLRWTNPVGGDWDGVIYLWTANGRPQVVASIYQGYHREGEPVSHEFHSLSLTPFTAERNNQDVWTPKKAGVELKPIADAPAPAALARRRLLQIRALAREFEVEKTDRDATKRTLRLLPRPLFR